MHLTKGTKLLDYFVNTPHRFRNALQIQSDCNHLTREFHLENVRRDSEQTMIRLP